MADKRVILGEIKDQVGNNHRLLLDSKNDYLGLMPYVISMNFQSKMKESMISTLEIPTLAKDKDYKVKKINKVSDLSGLMPLEFGIGLNHLYESVKYFSREIDEPLSFLNKRDFDNYIYGLSAIKNSIYALKNNESKYVDYYSLVLERLIEFDTRFKEYDCITCVPSSNPNKISGLESILSRLDNNVDKECIQLLKKTRYTTPKHMSVEENKSTDNDFNLKNDKKYKGIIIIDDVITSGQTLETCTLLLSMISELPVIKIALTETVNLTYHEPKSNKYFFSKYRNHSVDSIFGNLKSRSIYHAKKYDFLYMTSLFVYKALEVNQIAFKKNGISSIFSPEKNDYFKIQKKYFEFLFGKSDRK